MKSSDIISVYENVSIITEQMVMAASIADWVELAALESRCASQVEMLRENEMFTPLQESERAQKVKLIKSILSNDRRIRVFTEPWIDKLASTMNVANAKRSSAATQTSRA